jgi:hypothetical protein
VVSDQGSGFREQGNRKAPRLSSVISHPSAMKLRDPEGTPIGHPLCFGLKESSRTERVGQPASLHPVNLKDENLKDKGIKNYR